MKDHKRVEELTLKALDREASDAELEELERLVASDEGARKMHIDLLEQEAALRGERGDLDLGGAVVECIRSTVGKRVEDGVMSRIRGRREDETGEGSPVGTDSIRPIEPEWPWLGGRRFWLASAAAAAVIVAAVALHASYVDSRRARPQEAFLYGQPELTPGVPTAYRAFVRNAATSEPVGGARVRFALLDPSGARVWRTSGTTGEGGMIEVVPELPADAAEGDYTLKLEASSAAGESTVSRGVGLKRSFKAMVTTDKPLYQPGQVIHMRALALANADLRPVAARRAVIEVQDAKGNKVFKKVTKTSDFGIVSADFVLADQVNTGEYTVSATVGDTTSERSVTVKRYRLPKFKVTLSTDRGYYAPGDKVECDLSADYTFGKPVAGGKVRVVASEFVERLRPFAEASGTTDAEGRFRFEIPLKRHFVGQEVKKGDAFVTFEATVVDTAGHKQKKTLDLTITTDPIRIEVFPESGTLVRDVENVLYMVTAYPDGRPAKTRLTIGKTRETVETSEVGIAKVKITPRKSNLQLTIAAEDRFGVRATATRRLRVGARVDSILLRTDRAVYRVGETAKLSVLSPSARGRVFLDVVKDRRTVLVKGIDVLDGRGELALDIPADLFGTLELHAYRIVRDGNIVGDAKVIQVTRADGIKITAKLDKNVYRPAEKAVLELVAERTGKEGRPEPVQAALGLAGVDEAVFALQEMRPGLERVYFMLQEEILKPRYEICAHPPVSARELLRRGRPEEPELPPELEEASVVLFSSAEGTAPPARDMSLTFAAKNEHFEMAKERYFAGLWGMAALVPVLLFFLSTLPLIAYAVSRLFRREPIEGADEKDVREPGQAARWTAVWWALGVYLPWPVGILAIATCESLSSNMVPTAILSGLTVGVATYLVLASMGLRGRRRWEPSAWNISPALVAAGLSLFIVLAAANGPRPTYEESVLLFLASTLPLIAYAIWRTTRNAPVGGASRNDVRELARAGRWAAIWWTLGFYLPFAGALVGAIIGRALFGWGDEGLTAVLFAIGAGIVALVKLSIWVVRFRRCAASRAAPIMRKLVSALPFAFVLAAVSLVSLIAAVESRWPRALGGGTVAILLLLMALTAILAVGAISAAGHSVVKRITVGQWFKLALGRAGLAVVPALAVLVLVTPLMFAGRGMMMGPAPEMVEFAPAGTDEEGPPEFRRSTIRKIRRSVLDKPKEGPTTTEDGGARALKAPTRIRRYFPETLLWKPELITDTRGRAWLEVPLADSITTWRIAMSAVSARGELGSATKGLRVFQDFFVDIDFPVALTQHDRVSVPVAVYNYLDRPQTVRLEVEERPWFRLLPVAGGERVREVRIGAKEVTSVYLTMEALKPGSHSLLVKAYGSEMADAVERSVRVEPDGKPFLQTINGRLGENLTREFTIPEGAIDGASDLVVKIYPGSFSQVIEGLDSIFRMPYGCFEQTSSTTYPNILVLDYMRRTKQIKPEIEMKALNFINLGYQRLLSFEVTGGGFDWYGRAPADTVLTAYGLMEFSDMAEVYEVDPAVITRTREWLHSKQERDGSWAPGRMRAVRGAPGAGKVRLRTTAYVAWAMAEAEAEDSRDRRLSRALEYVASRAEGADDPYTLAVAANALVAGGHRGAKSILTRLDGLKKVEGKLVHWSSAGQGVTYSRGDVLDIETTALAAYAYLKASFRTGEAHKALAWLVEKKDARGTWHSTQATVHAMRALLSGAGPSGAVEGELAVTVAANGKLAKELVITPETSDVFRLVSLRELVREGRNDVSLEVAGKGELAYQIVATHYMPWPRAEAPAREKELTIDVAYDTTRLRRDDTLSARVTIRYNRPGTANMTIIDLGIPPGFEVIRDIFEALKEHGLIERYSVTGRQVILYLRELEGGKPFAFDYKLRAKFPVRVKTPRSRVYQYYEPELRDEAEPVEITVL